MILAIELGITKFSTYGSRLSLFIHLGIGSQNQLILTNDCPCPGQNLTFECTIVGGGTTVWQGAQVFDCPNFSNQILLRHNSFGSSVMGECNAGSIVGRSLRVDGNRYTSQLSIEYNEHLNGSNITCAHDDGFTISSRLSLMITQNMIGNRYCFNICDIKIIITIYSLARIQFPSPPQTMCI